MHGTVHKIIDGLRTHEECVVENNIPIPDHKKEKKNGCDEKYPMKGLQPGQSFYAKNVESPGRFYARATKLGYKITVKQIGNGFRVWRLPDPFRGDCGSEEYRPKGDT